MNSFTGRFVHLLQRFTRSQRGNVAMIAGIALPVLLMISAGAIDLHNAAKVKSELQDALDAATLAAARSNGTTNAEVQKVGMASLKANMPNYFLTNPGDVASFTVNNRTAVQATATVQVKTIIANVFLPPYGQLFDDYLPMGASSNVLRASRNVEVAVALDITGSMKNYMDDLQSAAKELVKIVVQGDQSIFTTRMALVPYAAGVNAGDAYAVAMRGALQAATTIRTADAGQSATVTPSNWSRSGSTLTISRSNHGLGANRYVVIKHTRNNNTVYEIYRVTSAQANSFTISRNSNLGTNVSYRACTYDECAAEVTSVDHKLVDGEYVNISNVSGLTNLNGNYRITKIDQDKFLAYLSANYHNSYTRGGSVQCGRDGCEKRVFINRQGGVTLLPSSTCVSERPRGSATPSDRAPSEDNWVGRSYLESGNACPSAVLTPLTSQVDDKGKVKGLNSLIDGYKDGGSTAGQIGIEQAWYAISPTFGSIFPAESRPNRNNTSETVKAVILMTDGDFNTPFCEGAIANTAPNKNTGSLSAHINCPATNGSPFTQSVAICEKMKTENIVVYTVSFNLGTGTGGPGIDTAYEVMEECATSPDHFFSAADGTDLKEAFKSIGRDITRLRIAR